MTYNQALKIVFTKRKCNQYVNPAYCPPCCSDGSCGCIDEAKQMIEELSKETENAQS